MKAVRSLSLADLEIEKALNFQFLLKIDSEDLSQNRFHLSKEPSAGKVSRCVDVTGRNQILTVIHPYSIACLHVLSTLYCTFYHEFDMTTFHPRLYYTISCYLQGRFGIQLRFFRSFSKISSIKTCNMLLAAC